MMGVLYSAAPAKGIVDLDHDHDLIHGALYASSPEPFGIARSRLIRAILHQRARGLLPNDSFEDILNTVRNTSTQARVFNLFQVQLPEDIACA